MEEHVKALTQSYTRTKATNYKSFRQTMELHTNSSNNTIFADADGDIAYFHGNFIPRRDTKFDWTKPVDGSNPATEWHGLLSIDETPHLLNPKSGWLYNSNNWPWSAAGPSSPKREDYPSYVETGGETARGLHAIRVLENKKDFTVDSLIAAAYDSYLTWFGKPIPCLLKAWDAAPSDDALKAKLAGQIAALRDWDLRWGVGSVPTSLAVFWGEDMQKARGRRGEKRRRVPQRLCLHEGPARNAAAIAFGRIGQAFVRFRNLENPVGRHQPFPAANRRYLSDIQRCWVEHSGGLHFFNVGLAGVVWSATLSRNKKVVRHERQQFCRRGRIWQNGARSGRDSRRRKRPSVVTTLQRRGRTIRHGKSTRCLFLPLATEGTHREGIPSRELSGAVCSLFRG